MIFLPFHFHCFRSEWWSNQMEATDKKKCNVSYEHLRSYFGPLRWIFSRSLTQQKNGSQYKKSSFSYKESVNNPTMNAHFQNHTVCLQQFLSPSQIDFFRSSSFFAYAIRNLSNRKWYYTILKWLEQITAK